MAREPTRPGERRLLRRRRFVAAGERAEALAGAPKIDPERFRAETDAVLEQDPPMKPASAEKFERIAGDLPVDGEG